MAAVEIPGAPITSVCAVAALGSEPIDIDKVLPQVRHYAGEAARRLEALQKTREDFTSV